MKFRWSLALLLLLLPLTMAPKIALVPEGQPIDVTALVTREAVRVGTPVTLVVSVTNLTGAALPAVSVTTQFLLDDGRLNDSASFLRLSHGCAIDPQSKGDIAVCDVGDLDPGETERFRLGVRATAAGTLTFDVVPTVSATLNPQTVPATDISVQVR